MKKSLLVGKRSRVGAAAAVAGVFGAAATHAQAVTLQWKDLNPAGAFVALDKLNTIASPQFYHVTLGQARRQCHYRW